MEALEGFMHLRRLFGVLVLGGGAMIASGCGGDGTPHVGGPQQQLIPDGGVNPMTGGGAGGGGSTGGGGGGGVGGGGGGGGGGGAPPGW